MIRRGDETVELKKNKDQGLLAGRRGGARNGAGRKPIGITRKISLTLPQEYWEEIDRCCRKGDYSISEVLRALIEDNLHHADSL
ncbi:ribbon-helix-helix CopG family protein [Cohnella sp. SGD-V74]|uniref:ribbon-helix-helix domain-containing protein n=1 Tax=unclassified Cohnella TaxID=2636738 RepID=UPI000D4B5615|nr:MULTISPECIES: ribbon-helix-helix domain-containing protein [unclassified Cohnella]PRX73018.1 ribbon-helix-helix CopG family protein [Cohnella sp. SGD-V74]